MASNTDVLTGVLNAEAFRQEVSALIADKSRIALLLLNLDKFRRVNESLGRDSGDRTLVDIVDTVKKRLRKNDLIGRIGGDEFFICISNLEQISVVEHIAKQVCQQSRTMIVADKPIHVSVGVVIVPNDGTDYDSLCEKARCAMCIAKQKGGNGYVFYDENLATDCECSKNDNFEVSDRDTRIGSNHIIISYSKSTGKFVYPTDNELFGRVTKDILFWEMFEQYGIASQNTARRIHDEFDELLNSNVPQAHFTEAYLRNKIGKRHWYRIEFINSSPNADICIVLTDINYEIINNKNLLKMTQYDPLTGLLNRHAFCSEIDSVYESDPEGMANGMYSIIYFDISRFKAINDLFGMEEGDRLLKYIADVIKNSAKYNDKSGRIGSDRYVLFINNYHVTPEDVIEQLHDAFAAYDLPFEISFNAGIYITNEEHLRCETMIDRAILAQSSVKGSFTQRSARFDEKMRDAMLSEQEIVGMMRGALTDKHFVVYYQPQYNHSTGMLVGAEALVRWNHPEKGLISPGAFIPIFEKNGFITHLDLYVFEEVCIFLRKSIDAGHSIVAIGTNFSRYDIYLPDFVERLETIRRKYDIPVKYLRIELTESAMFGSSQHANYVIKGLHKHGYIVEMDDFGSGYSSLNVLKDIELDIIKLDMKFLQEANTNNKGGTILSSIVRMAKWLQIPVIAEGVEQTTQADFLRSIGCYYIQGYLYSRPLPETDYVNIVNKDIISTDVPQVDVLSMVNANNFWDPTSLETLIFSNYVGGACIFEFNGKDIEVLRVNTKYLQELSMNLSEKDVIRDNPLRFLDEENTRIYHDMLQRAIETNEEQECETFRNIQSECCGSEVFVIRSNVRVIGKNGDAYLFYSMIRNVTNERRQYDMLMANDIGFKTVTEQVNIYFWEYNILTKEMKPCFRCMRDLNLPPLVKNYPEPLVESGIIPAQYAQAYRDFLKQLETGVESIEGDFALLPELIPFRFRYTTEFDESGRPVKAYASATLIRE